MLNNNIYELKQHLNKFLTDKHLNNFKNKIDNRKLMKMKENCLKILLLLACVGHCFDFVYNFKQAFKPFENENYLAITADTVNNVYVSYSNLSVIKYSPEFKFLADLNNLFSKSPIDNLQIFNYSLLNVSHSNVRGAEIIVGQAAMQRASEFYVVDLLTLSFIRLIYVGYFIFSVHIYGFYINSVLTTFGALGCSYTIFIILPQSLWIYNTYPLAAVLSEFKTGYEIINDELNIYSFYVGFEDSVKSILLNTNYTINLITNNFVHSESEEYFNPIYKVQRLAKIGDISIFQAINKTLLVTAFPHTNINYDSTLSEDLLYQYVSYFNKHYLIYNNSIKQVEYNNLTNYLSVISSKNYQKGNGYYHLNGTIPPIIFNGIHMYAMGTCLDQSVYNLTTGACIAFECTNSHCAKCPQKPFKCEECEEGYTLKQWECIKNNCTELCLSCALDLTCFNCPENFTINETDKTICSIYVPPEPVPEPPPPPIIITECEIGYSIIMNECIENPCNEGCQICESNYTCLLCSKYFAFNDSDPAFCYQTQVIGATLSFNNSIASILSCPSTPTSNGSSKCPEALSSPAVKSNVEINQQLVKIPFLAQILQFFEPIFILNNDYWYYLYHNRDYSMLFWTKTLFNLMAFINTDRMSLFNFTFIDVTYKSALKRFFKSNYTLYSNSNVVEIDKSSTYFILNMEDYFVWRFLFILIIWLIIKFIAAILKCSLSKEPFEKISLVSEEKKTLFEEEKKQKNIINILNKFFEKKGMLIMLLEQLFKENIVFIGFYCSLQFKNCFLFVFTDKINNLLNYYFFFLALFFSCSFYLLSYAFLAKKSSVLIENRKNKAYYGLILIRTILSFSHGFLQGFFLENYETLMECLIFIKIVRLFTTLYYKKELFNIISFVFSFSFNVFALFFDIFLFYSFFLTNSSFFNYIKDILEEILLGGLFATLIMQIIIISIFLFFKIFQIITKTIMEIINKINEKIHNLRKIKRKERKFNKKKKKSYYRLKEQLEKMTSLEAKRYLNLKKINKEKMLIKKDKIY